MLLGSHRRSAGMDHEAGRLVDHDQVRVLVDDGERDGFRLRRGVCGRGHPHEDRRPRVDAMGLVERAEPILLVASAQLRRASKTRLASRHEPFVGPSFEPRQGGRCAPPRCARLRPCLQVPHAVHGIVDLRLRTDMTCPYSAFSAPPTRAALAGGSPPTAAADPAA